MNARGKRYLPYIFFSVLTLVILGPGLRPGYLFLLDMPWPTHFQLSDYISLGPPHLPIIMLLRIFNTVVPAWLLQKCILFVVLSGAGSSMYLLLKHVHSKVAKTPSLHASLIALLGGTLALMNPFVFERISAGQWLVLAGYAYTPFLIYIYVRYQSGLRFWLAYAFFPIVSVHFWAMVSISGAIALLLTDRDTLKAIARRAELYIVFIIVNAFWIGRLIRGDNSAVNRLASDQFVAFRTLGDPTVGIIGNVLSLHGFWRPQSAVLKEQNTLWFVFALVVLSLTLYGLWQARSSAALKKYAAASDTVLIMALVFAIGYGHPAAEALVAPLSAIPLAAALRETAKAIGLLALLYAFWVPYGLYKSVVKHPHTPPATTFGASMIITIIMTAGMLFGLNGSLQTYQYPSDWREINNELPRSATVLVLPWQGYLELNFAQNAYVANPARLLIDADVLQSESSGNSVIDSESPEELLIDQYLNQAISEQTLKDELAKQFHVTHIILLKTGNWQRYEDIGIATMGSVIKDSESIRVIRL